MENISLLKEKIGDKNVLIDEDMYKHTSFKTGGKADIFVKIDSIEKIKYVLNFAKEKSMPLFIIGNGSNLLVTDKGYRGIICKIEINKFEIKEKGENILVTVRSRKQKCKLGWRITKKRNRGHRIFITEYLGTIRRSDKNECRSIRKRNERHSSFHKISRL